MPEKTSHPDTALPKCRSRTDEAVRPLSFSNISRLVGEYVFGSGSSSVASTVGDPRVDGITKTPDMSPDSQTDSPVDPFFKPRPFLSRQMSGIKWKNNRFSRLASLHTNTGDAICSQPPPNYLGITLPSDEGTIEFPSDWIPRKMPPRDQDDSTSARTPLSCITDSFNEESSWSLFGDGDNAYGCQGGVDPHRAPGGDVIAESLSRTPENVDFLRRDCGKEVAYVDTGLSCRIESVLTSDDYPEFVPADDVDEPDREKKEAKDEREHEAKRIADRLSKMLEAGTIQIPPRPLDSEHPAYRRHTSPVIMPGESMVQDWPETPAAKTKTTRLERMSLPAAAKSSVRSMGFFANLSQVSLLSSRSGTFGSSRLTHRNRGGVMSQLSLVSSMPAGDAGPSKFPTPRPSFLPPTPPLSPMIEDMLNRKSPDIGRPSRFPWRLWR